LQVTEWGDAPRALVTGASGFIGSHLLRHLAGAGWETAVLLRPAAAEAFAATQARSAVYPITGRTADVVRAVAEFEPQTVFHLASLFLGSHTSAQVEPLISANILFGAQLLEAMHLAGVRRLVNAGTLWQNYHSPTYRPANLYAATKQAFEDIVAYYAGAARIRAVTLRLCDSYGPGDRRRKLIPLLLASLRSGESLPMSPGEQVVDLAHVDDICRAFVHAAGSLGDSAGSLGESAGSLGDDDRDPAATVYAISGGQRRTLREVAATLEEAAGARLPVQFGALPYREREVMSPWTGPALPGWKPQVKLLDGLKALVRAEACEGAWNPQTLRRPGAVSQPLWLEPLSRCDPFPAARAASDAAPGMAPAAKAP